MIWWFWTYSDLYVCFHGPCFQKVLTCTPSVQPRFEKEKETRAIKKNEKRPSRKTCVQRKASKLWINKLEILRTKPVRLRIARISNASVAAIGDKKLRSSLKMCKFDKPLHLFCPHNDTSRTEGVFYSTYFQNVYWGSFIIVFCSHIHQFQNYYVIWEKNVQGNSAVIFDRLSSSSIDEVSIDKRTATSLVPPTTWTSGNWFYTC